jgi:hypothetical protein
MHKKIHLLYKMNVRENNFNAFLKLLISPAKSLMLAGR